MRVAWRTVGGICGRVCDDARRDAAAGAGVMGGVSGRRRLEGLHGRIRLISHRSFGIHSAAPLIALVYLCCARVVIDLPR